MNYTDYHTNTYTNLVLSGGGLKALAHVGALKKLTDAHIIDLANIKAVAASSAGSLLACLIVLGFSIDEIWKFVMCIDLKKLVNPDPMSILQKCGVESGQIIQSLYEDILTKKTDIANITFAQLYEKTAICFTVVGANLTKKQPVYYSYLNTPDFTVSLAIRISISVPGFFIPVEIDGEKYIDGGILNNYPINLFETEQDRTLGILIDNEYDTSYRYPEEYFMAIINLFMYHFYNRMYQTYAKNTIFIKNVSHIFVFNFNIDDLIKTELYQAGIKAVEEFITKGQQ